MKAAVEVAPEIEQLRERVAIALEATTGQDNRGDRTYHARVWLREWLEVGTSSWAVFSRLEWLEGVARAAAADA